MTGGHERTTVVSNACLSSLSTEILAKWQTLAARLGFRDFLTPEDGFRTCLESRQRWGNADQPGIYFWIAEDGEAYVGQSVSPRARLREHWRNHRDLVRVGFLPCAAQNMDGLEKTLIQAAGDHFPLRNIKMAIATSREMPFDKVVDENDRKRFELGQSLSDREWRHFDLLEQVQRKKYNRLLSTPWGKEAINRVQTFVHAAIPRPAATEVGFWSVTIFPERRFVRVNAGQQEVFTLEEGSKNARVLSDARLSWLRASKESYSVTSYTNDVRVRELAEWLSGKRLLACRRLVVRLMRHTIALNSGSHCPQVVRYDGRTADLTGSGEIRV